MSSEIELHLSLLLFRKNYLSFACSLSLHFRSARYCLTASAINLVSKGISLVSGCMLRTCVPPAALASYSVSDAVATYYLYEVNDSILTTLDVYTLHTLLLDR